MKRFFTAALITGVPFGIVMGSFAGLAIGWVQGPRYGVFAGILAALGSGLLFGVSMAGFSLFQRKRFVQVRPNFSGEPVIHEGPANHFCGGEGTGGWLYLTSRRVFFKSHSVNLHPHETTILLSEISDARPIKTARFIPNGLEVVLTTGQSERFVVEKHNQWSQAISRARTQL